MQELVKAVFLIGASQSLFLGILLLSKSEKRHPNKFLALLLLSFSIEFSLKYLLTGDFSSAPGYLIYIVVPLKSLYGPFAYLTVKAVITGKQKLKLSDYAHFIVFAVSLSFFFVMGYLLSIQKQNTLNTGYIFSFTHILTFLVLFVHLTGLIYFLYSLYLIKIFSRNLREIYSETGKLNIYWFYHILAALIILYFINSLPYLNLLDGEKYTSQGFYGIVNVLIILITAVYFIRQPEIFYESGLLSQIIHGKNSAGGTASYQKQSLSEDDSNNLYKELLHYMDKEKPFSDEAIKINELARQLSMQPHHLSIIINRHYGNNFYHFINSYRIKEFEKKLKSGPFEKSTILRWAYESGFNSKSSFNRFFKEYYGMPPTEYIKKKFL